MKISDWVFPVLLAVFVLLVTAVDNDNDDQLRAELHMRQIRVAQQLALQKQAQEKQHRELDEQMAKADRLLSLGLVK